MPPDATLIRRDAAHRDAIRALPCRDATRCAAVWIAAACRYAIFRDAGRRATGQRSCWPVPGRHTAIASSGDNDDDRNATAANGAEVERDGGGRYGAESKLSS